SWSWFLGWAFSLCALVTAAGGVMVPFAIVCVAALGALNDPRRLRDLAKTGGVALLVLGAGAAVASPALPAHQSLNARTLTEFTVAFTRNMAWPWIDRPLMSVIMWLPTVALLVAIWRRRGRTNGLERFAIGLGVWVLLISGAIAYGRGAGGARPIPR